MIRALATASTTRCTPARPAGSRAPQLASADSPTRRVGGAPRTDLKTVEHVVPMMSLDNTYDQKELDEFVRRVHAGLPHGATPAFCVEPKLDGASVEICIATGSSPAADRGDGVAGEDISENLRTIRSLPMTIEHTGPLTLRGEVVILSTRSGGHQPRARCRRRASVCQPAQRGSRQPAHVLTCAQAGQAPPARPDLAGGGVFGAAATRRGWTAWPSWACPPIGSTGSAGTRASCLPRLPPSRTSARTFPTRSTAPW